MYNTTNVLKYMHTTTSIYKLWHYDIIAYKNKKYMSYKKSKMHSQCEIKKQALKI